MPIFFDLYLYFSNLSYFDKEEKSVRPKLSKRGKRALARRYALRK